MERIYNVIQKEESNIYKDKLLNVSDKTIGDKLMSKIKDFLETLGFAPERTSDHKKKQFHSKNGKFQNELLKEKNNQPNKLQR